MTIVNADNTSVARFIDQLAARAHSTYLEFITSSAQLDDLQNAFETLATSPNSSPAIIQWSSGVLNGLKSIQAALPRKLLEQLNNNINSKPKTASCIDKLMILADALDNMGRMVDADIIDQIVIKAARNEDFNDLTKLFDEPLDLSDTEERGLGNKMITEIPEDDEDLNPIGEEKGAKPDKTMLGSGSHNPHKRRLSDIRRRHELLKIKQLLEAEDELPQSDEEEEKLERYLEKHDEEYEKSNKEREEKRDAEGLVECKGCGDDVKPGKMHYPGGDPENGAAHKPEDTGPEENSFEDESDEDDEEHHAIERGMDMGNNADDRWENKKTAVELAFDQFGFLFTITNPGAPIDLDLMLEKASILGVGHGKLSNYELSLDEYLDLVDKVRDRISDKVDSQGNKKRNVWWEDPPEEKNYAENDADDSLIDQLKSKLKEVPDLAMKVLTLIKNNPELLELLAL